jgi:hypothetical protein
LCRNKIAAGQFSALNEALGRITFAEEGVPVAHRKTLVRPMTAAYLVWSI